MTLYHFFWIKSQVNYAPSGWLTIGNGLPTTWGLFLKKCGVVEITPPPAYSDHPPFFASC